MIRFRKLIIIAYLLTSNIAFADTQLIFCDSCNTSIQKFAAEKILNATSGKLLIYDKNTEKMQKWGMTNTSESEAYDEIDEEKPVLSAVKLSLSFSEVELKSSIDQLIHQYKSDNANDELHEFIDLDHSLFADATSALIDYQGYIKAVYDNLAERDRWYGLQKNIETYQNNKRNSSTFTANIPSVLTGHFTKGPGSKSYIIHVTHPNGSTVRLAIDTTMDIYSEIYRSIVFVIAKDAAGQTLPQDKSSLNAVSDQVFSGDDSDIYALAGFISTFDNVSLEEVCAPQDTLSCRSGGRKITDGKVRYVLICTLGKESKCN